MALTLLSFATFVRVSNSGDYGMLSFLSNPGYAVGFTLIVVALWLTTGVIYWVGSVKE